MKDIERAVVYRSVLEVCNSTAGKEGAGFSILRPFPTRTLSYVDPFLLLDHMQPVPLKPGEAKGAPDHPHRGFETVTYLLEGAMEHRDSAGNFGRLTAGDVQWMTAGAGVVHSEMPGPELLQHGGVLHGFQIWVDLPAALKMTAPRYQDLSSAKIPVAVSADGLTEVKVIAGESLGIKAPTGTHTPITFLHIKMAAGAVFTQPLGSGQNALVYIVSGTARFGPGAETVEGTGKMVRFALEDRSLYLENAGADDRLDLLVLAGQPLNQPVARYGPFVMNSEAEIEQALEDYRSGRMGQIAGA